MDGRGAGSIALNMPTPPRNLTDPAFQAARTDEQLLSVLRNGKGNMPPFGALFPENELVDVLAYVRTLARPGEH
jgi:mono/diheme cytochrome c family protein